MFKKFLDLGNQPLANSYLLNNNSLKKEITYKLKVGINLKNYLVSIENTVPKEKMFNAKYPYRSSMSFTMRSSFKNLAKKILNNYKPQLVLEIGSNDGAFIKNFNKNIVIGVEPCKNLARITRNHGYKTFSSYWNLDLAKKITRFKKVNIIYSANTISHIKDLDSVIKAIDFALAKNGILIIEDPSLMECLKSTAYDQFYCEHIYVFSAIALHNIFKKYNFEIFKIEKIKTHGGSNRYYIKRKDNQNYRIEKSCKALIIREIRYGLKRYSTYLKFKKSVEKSKIKLLQLLNDFKKKKLKVIGYGATAKSVTVLNYCKINKNLISYFLDTTPDKVNKYLPGSKILIKKYKKLDKKDVDVVFLGAWNFKEEILKKEKKFISMGGKFITHIPFPRII
jgi:SAM-dependent methyltransferase